MSKVELHIGTYSAAGGQGLHRLDYDPAEGFMPGPVYAGAANASFGAMSRRHRLHYLVDEQTDGRIGVYRRQEGGWTRLAFVPAYGAEPCYVALDPAEQRLAVANYGDGSIALFNLDDDGLPQEAPGSWQGDGRGTDPERQDKPHIHCVRFSSDGRYLHAVDLGTDRILCFDIEAGALTTPEVAWRAPPGSGPRHLLSLSGERAALLVDELASDLNLLRLNRSAMTLRASRSTLPATYDGDSLGGHLAVNAAGDRVYVSNRGHDSIVVFHLDAEAGTLEPVQHVPSQGASPRFFLLLEDIGRLILANEEGGNVVAFAIAGDGRLTPTGHAAAVPGAVFVLRIGEAGWP